MSNIQPPENYNSLSPQEKLSQLIETKNLPLLKEFIMNYPNKYSLINHRDQQMQ